VSTVPAEIHELENLAEMQQKVAPIVETWSAKDPLIAEFVAAARGYHLILVMPDLDAATSFYTDVIGMAVSDTGAEEWAGIVLSAVFAFE